MESGAGPYQNSSDYKKSVVFLHRRAAAAAAAAAGAAAAGAAGRAAGRAAEWAGRAAGPAAAVVVAVVELKGHESSERPPRCCTHSG